MSASTTSGQGEISAALRAYRSVFVIVALFSAVINLLLLVPSIYMLQVYDRVLPSRNETTLIMLTGIMVGLYVLSGLIEYVRSRVVIALGEQFDRRLSDRVYEAAFRRGLNSPGQSAGQAVTDLTSLRQFMTGSALFAFFDAPWFPVYLAVIFAFDPILGWFATAGTVVLVLLAWINERITHTPMKQAAQSAIVSDNLATNTLRNAEAIHAMGMLGGVRARWRDVHRSFLASQSTASDRSAGVAALSKFIRMTEQSLVLGIGAALVIRNELTPGMMVAASILAGRALSPVDQVIASWRQFSSARGANARLRELLARHPAQTTGLPLPQPRGQASLKGVSVVPPGRESPVLQGIDLEIAPGEVLGVVGASGSGKSSLARVLLGIWPAQSGVVRLDGADIQQLSRDAIGPSLGYLPQDVELFAGTVADNIARFGTPAPEAVVSAAQMAGVHDLILRLPKGYDTVLGDGGGGLSGGQKQRLGLARAIYGMPKLLVLDEPNSNLDDAGEIALLAAMAQMRRAGSAVVLITHRASTLAACDRLLVLHEGAVQMSGTRAEVIAQMAQVTAAAKAKVQAVQPAQAAQGGQA